MSFTTIPAAGAKLRGSVLASLITELRPVSVIASSDQNATSNSTVLINDTQLFLPYIGPATYRVELDLIYAAGTTADFKFAFTFANVSAFNWVADHFDPNLAYLANDANGYGSGSAVSIGGAGTGAPRSVKLVGNMTTTGSGTLQLQFAQNVAAVETEVRKGGSMLMLQRLA